MPRWTTPLRSRHGALCVLVLCLLLAGPAATGAASTPPIAGESPRLVAPPAAVSSGPGPAQVTRVRLGELGILGGAGYYLAIENGYFAEQGIEVEPVRFTTGGEMTPPLAAGQLDVGAGGITAGLFNAMARGLNLRIVSDHGYSAPGRPVNALVVRRDLLDTGQVRTAADLRGRRIAIPSTTVAAMTDVRAYVAEGGLALSDVRVDELPFPDMLPALANGSIDAATPVEPFITFMVQRGLGSVWRWDYDVNPDHQVGVVMYAPAFIGDRPEIARRWMVAYLRGLRYFNDGFVRGDTAARERSIDVLMQWTAIRDRALYETMTVIGLDPNGGVRVPSMRADQEFFVQQGYQERPIDLDVAVDLQYVQYARQVLGPYP
jgi:NitT/TauT family transport system substrate-binding protein